MSRRTQPRSIHDSDAPQAVRARRARPSRSLRVRKVVSIALVTAGLAGFAFAVLTHDDRAGDQTSELASAQEGEYLDVLMDGWSLTTLGDLELTATWDGGQSSSVQFVAVDSADLSQLQETSPQLLTEVLAREVTASSDLSCTTSGCGADDVQLDTGVLLPGADGEAASFLVDAGVTAPLVRARLQVPAGSSVVQLSAPGYDTLSLTTSQQVPAGDDEDAGLAEPSMLNGFQRGRWLVAAGLGRLFIPQASWVGSGEARESVTTTATGDLPANAAGVALGAARTVVAATGLGDPFEGASAWTPSQLTLMTSPTQGCSAVVVCFPGSLQDVTQSAQPVQSVAVMTQVGDTGVALVDDRVLSLNLPAPIHQVGVDGLLSGRVELRVVSATLLQGPELTSVDAAGGSGLASEDTTAYSPAAVLGNVRLAGQTWVVAE